MRTKLFLLLVSFASLCMATEISVQSRQNRQTVTKHQPIRNEITLKYDTEEYNNSIGASDPMFFEIAIKLTGQELSGSYGKLLKNIMFYLAPEPGQTAPNWSSITAKIYRGTEPNKPSHEVLSLPVTNAILGDWTVVNTETAGVVIEQGYDYWIGYSIQTIGGWPLGCDLGPHSIGKSQWMKNENGDWIELTSLGANLTFNWHIRATTTSEFVDSTNPTVSGIGGTTAYPNEIMNISAIVSDATGIAAVTGHYQLSGQSVWTDFTMSVAKQTNIYEGNIPAQVIGTTGKVKFTTTDTHNPANSGDSPEYNIAWQPTGIFSTGETFDGSFPPNGWKHYDINSSVSTELNHWQKESEVLSSEINCFAAHEWHVIDDDGLLVTPQIKVNNGGKFKFSEKTYWPSGYFYHAVKISTTDNQPESFTELQVFPADTVEVWAEKTIDLSAYAGQKIYLAFNYKGNMSDSWRIDNVKAVNCEPVDMNTTDNACPSVESVNGTSVLTGKIMNITAKIFDRSGIASAVCEYKLSDQTNWTSLPLTETKGTNVYSATIPSQQTVTDGVIRFILTDSWTCYI